MIVDMFSGMMKGRKGVGHSRKTLMWQLDVDIIFFRHCDFC